MAGRHSRGYGRQRGLEHLLAVVILVSIVTVAAFGISFYLLKILESIRDNMPVKLEIYNSGSFGRLGYFHVKNNGGRTVYLTKVLINDIPVDVRLVFDPENPNVSYPFINLHKDIQVPVKPGETVVVFFLYNNVLKPRVSYKVTVECGDGYQFSTIIRPDRSVDIAAVGRIRLLAYNSTSGVWKMVEFNPVTWEYRFWMAELTIKNNSIKGGIDGIVLTGKNGKVGTISDPPPPLYTGDTPVLTSPTMYCGNVPHDPSSPIIVVLNTHTQRGEWNFTWINLGNVSRSGHTYKNINRFILEPIGNGVPGLDYILMLEDQWAGPNDWFDVWSNSSDIYSYTDQVIRVTWLKDGGVRVGLYRAGGHPHILIYDSKTIYYLPSIVIGEIWPANSTRPICNPSIPVLNNTYCFQENFTETYYNTSFGTAFYEIGYDDRIIDANGIIIKLWYINGG